VSPRLAAALVGLGALAGARSPAHASSCKGALETALEIAGAVAEAAADGDGSGEVAAPCEEVSDVHGHRRCAAFGRWGTEPDRAPWFFEVGSAVRRFGSPLGERTGSLSHDGESFSYRVVGPAARAPSRGPHADLATAGVVSARVGRGFAYGLFLAADAEVGLVGGGSASPEIVAERAGAMPDLRRSGVSVLGGAGVVGWRGQVDNFSLGVEAAGGFRALTYHFDSSYRACETTTSVTTGMPVVELRARASLRVAPDVAIGASGGRSVIDDGWVAGVHVSLHAFE